MTTAQQWLAIVLGVGGVLGLIVAWLRWLRPLFRTAAAVGDTILGREERRDRAGRITQAAVPSIAVQVADLTAAVKTLADVSHRMDRVEAVQIVQGNVQSEQAATIAELQAEFRRVRPTVVEAEDDH